MNIQTEMSIPELARCDIEGAMESIEACRQVKGMSMRALSTAAGLRPTSYWGMVRSKEKMRAVKATTLAALGYAVGLLP